MPSAVDQAYMAEIDWVSVRSSTVRRMGYLPDFRFLYIEFRSGGTYRYTVPRGVWEGLRAAHSKGQYVYYTLRGKGTDSLYPVVRVA